VKNVKDLDNVTNPAVPLEKRQENAAYIAHSIKLACLPKLDRYNANDVRQRTLDYLQMCSDDGMKPNIAGYALALGTNRAGLEAMFRDRRVDGETYGALDAGMTVIENVMVGLMLDQKINPVTAIFLLKNHFMGTYQDASQVTLRQERVDVIDTAALENKYKSVIVDADTDNLPTAQKDPV
jgi:hypothetical protein